MIVDIELTRKTNDRYAARALQFPGVIVEAPSHDAALAQMREALVARRRAGAEIVQIALDDAGVAAQPAWPQHADTFPDDEAYHSMLTEIDRQRQLLDNSITCSSGVR